MLSDCFMGIYFIDWVYILEMEWFVYGMGIGYEFVGIVLCDGFWW